MQLIERHSGSRSCSHLLNELTVMNLFQTTHQISQVRNQGKSVSFFHGFVITINRYTFTGWLSTGAKITSDTKMKIWSELQGYTTLSKM